MRKRTTTLRKEIRLFHSEWDLFMG